MPFGLTLIHNFARGFLDAIIFSIHFMLAQIFNFNRPESSQTGMKCDLGKSYPFYFKALNEFYTEVKAGSWRRNSSLMLGIHRLIPLLIFFIRLALDIFWKRRFTQEFQHLTEFFIGTFPEEPDSPSAA